MINSSDGFKYKYYTEWICPGTSITKEQKDTKCRSESIRSY